MVLSLPVLMLALTGCNNSLGEGKVHSVGMLVETTIHDQAWGKKGYEGLLKIQDKYNVDIYFKEGVKNQQQVNKAVDELVAKGVNVIFGHSSVYGEYFKSIHEAYPDVHFIYFNGGFAAENVTSLNFSGEAMGFFGGVVAGGFTKTNQVGLIAAHEWQPEVEGFYEGVKYQNPEAEVNIAFVHSWENTERAMKYYERMKEKGVDVFYPAGDDFNPPLIQRIQEDGKYAIGYVSDQSSLAEHTVLTSTVQHVDQTYVLAIERLINGELPGDTMVFDFQEGAITMGKYSDAVPDQLKENVKEMVATYKKSGELPRDK
nr:BMP family ABC transporter substrate-binding protein [Thalassobacillus pellis]